MPLQADVLGFDGRSRQFAKQRLPIRTVSSGSTSSFYLAFLTTGYMVVCCIIYGPELMHHNSCLDDQDMKAAFVP